MLEVSSGMNKYNSKELSMKHMQLVSSARMLATVDLISMFMFIQEQVLIFVAKNQP
jgi:hypothetical protein